MNSNEGNGRVEGATNGERASRWVLMPADQVPGRWADRSFPMAIVPLLPSELDELMQGRSVAPHLTAEEEVLAGYVAAGYSTEEIAKRVHMTTRSVYRRLARLRERVGAESTAELVSRLARMGF